MVEDNDDGFVCDTVTVGMEPGVHLALAGQSHCILFLRTTKFLNEQSVTTKDEIAVKIWITYSTNILVELQSFLAEMDPRIVLLKQFLVFGVTE